MLSNEPHCHYRQNPLAEVICQFRFPEILSIEANPPAEFQERIRSLFPVFHRRQELPPVPMNAIPTNPALMNVKPITNYQFSSADGIWRINLTSCFISLSCSHYQKWEEFASRLDQPLAAFIQIYSPSNFDRVGLRYVNFVSRKNLLLEGAAFRDLINPCYLGPLALEHIPESAISKSTVDIELALQGGCRGKVHAGPGIVKRNGIQDQEIKFIFDQDLYMAGPMAWNLAAGALNTLHTQAFSLFRGAISDSLHNAMDPDI